MPRTRKETEIMIGRFFIYLLAALRLIDASDLGENTAIASPALLKKWASFEVLPDAERVQLL
jgi:hypothetical protein